MESKISRIFTLAKNPESSPKFAKYRKIALQGLFQGLRAVFPQQMIQNKCHISDSTLHLDTFSVSLKDKRPVFIVGAGKACAQMVLGILDLFPESYPLHGIAILPKNQEQSTDVKLVKNNRKIQCIIGEHPIPAEAAVEGVKLIIQTILHLPPDPIIIVLLSGGASALLPFPVKQVSLADLQQTNSLLLKCGAKIQEMNIIRKHLSQIKGGALAKILQPFDSYALILSDVVGNDLQAIASGPTSPDTSTFSQALTICKRYQIMDQLPPSVLNYLQKGEMGLYPESPKPQDPCFRTMHNILLGDASTGLTAMKSFFEDLGFISKIYSQTIEGDARDYGIKLAQSLPSFTSIQFPSVFLGSGELTVHIRGNGTGGPNQEMLASFLHELETNPHNQTRKCEFLIIASSPDGKEGNSIASGALIDSESLYRIQKKSISLNDLLENNNTFSLFDQLDDAIITGSTGTNVNDFYIVFRISHCF